MGCVRLGNCTLQTDMSLSFSCVCVHLLDNLGRARKQFISHRSSSELLVSLGSSYHTIRLSYKLELTLVYVFIYFILPSCRPSDLKSPIDPKT